MSRIIVGDQQALVSQLLWQLRHRWDRQRSLESWHERHPDLSDDIFEQLYAYAVCQQKSIDYFNQAGGLLTIKECQEWARHK